MLGRAQNGETLTITQIVIGSGVAGQPSDLWPLTQLIAQEMATPISTKRDYGDGTLLVEGSILSSNAAAAFQLREVGVMAHVASEPDQLYSVANVFTDPPDTIDPAAPTVEAFKIKLIIDRIPTGNVIVQIGPTDNVLGENIGSDTVGAGIYKDAVGNVLYFKRLVAGQRISITEDPDENTIIIGAQVLKANLDLYVPVTYPGITDPTVLFPTIQAALDSLTNFIIPPNFFVTIHVYSGHFAQSAPINITHPNASQIKIIGLDVVSKNVTGAITTAGALPNVDVTVTIGNNTGMAVNDVVYLHNAPTAQLESCGYITSLIGVNQIKVRMRIQNVAPPASINALSTTKLVFFPTQIVSSIAGGAYLFNAATGCGQIKNFGMRSTIAQAAVAVGMRDSGSLENLAAVNFFYGFATNNGIVYLTPVIAANACNVGLSIAPGGNFVIGAPSPSGWNKVTLSGNLVYGMWVAGGSYNSSDGGSYTYTCSNGTGIRSDTRGWFGVSRTAPNTDGGWISSWNLEGGHAELLGIIETALNANNAIQSNVNFDLVAGSGGQIAIVYNTQSTGHYQPPNRTLGADGGYVSVLSP
jgi:hypothetical protein